MPDLSQDRCGAVLDHDSMADATCAGAVYTHLKEQRRRRSSPPAAVEHPSWAEGSASQSEDPPAKRAKRTKASAEDSLRIDPKLLREAGFDAGRKLEHRGDGALVRTHHGAKRDAKRDAKRQAKLEARQRHGDAEPSAADAKQSAATSASDPPAPARGEVRPAAATAAVEHLDPFTGRALAGRPDAAEDGGTKLKRQRKRGKKKPPAVAAEVPSPGPAVAEAPAAAPARPISRKGWRRRRRRGCH